MAIMTKFDGVMTRVEVGGCERLGRVVTSSILKIIV